MIRTEKFTFSIGDFHLEELDLHIERDKYFVLLGPPGSGKTILLESLCGLKRPRSGRIFIDGRDVTQLEPRKRGIGYVPQDYALFPHLSVEQNIAFALVVNKVESYQITRKVTETAELLGIRHLLTRSVIGLSGGEKQRTALARALVMEPRVLLLDEPVCALDECTRQRICALLARIQKHLSLTTVHVSHNLEEAFAVADSAAILNKGAIEQIASMTDLMSKPANEFVARFMRCENIFTGHVIRQDKDSNTTIVSAGSAELSIPGLHNATVKFLIRPENIDLLSQSSDRTNSIQAKLTGHRNYGSYIRVDLEGPLNLVAHLSPLAFKKLTTSSCNCMTAVLNRQSICVLTS